MNRRTFIELAGAGIATVSLRSTSAIAARAEKSGKAKKSSAEKAKPFQVTLGIQSYSFKDRPLDDAIEGMKAAGLTTVELWQGHLEPKNPANLDPKVKKTDDRKRSEAALRQWRIETPSSFFKDVAAKFKQAGISIYAYNYSFKDNFSDEEIDHGFRHATGLGATVITASANQQTVARIAPFAAKHKMKVGLHNHSNIKPNEFATPDDFKQAVQGKDREFIAFNLDIGHFVAAGFDPVAFLKENHQRIVTLHIKDRKKEQGPVVAFGEGDTPIKDILLMLRDNKWAIPGNIEYEYNGTDTIAEVKKCLEFCQRVLAG